MLVAMVIKFGVTVVYSKGHVGWLVSVSVGDSLGLVRCEKKVQLKACSCCYLFYVSVKSCECGRSVGR